MFYAVYTDIVVRVYKATWVRHLKKHDFGI